MNQTGDPTCKLSAEVSGKRPSRSAGSGKRKKQETSQPTREPCTNEKKESGSRRSQPHTAPRLAGNTARFLPKVGALLKTLTPELRLPVIRDEFTQQQRMQLEKWMVDQPSQNVPKALGSATPPASEYQASLLRRGKQQAQLASEDSCSTGCRFPGGRQRRQKVSRGICRMSNGGTSVWYHATVLFDNVRVRTRYTDLPTALEHLVVLTAIKQRMTQVETENDYASRTQRAAESSAAEHGRSVHELGLRFQVLHHSLLCVCRSAFSIVKVFLSPGLRCLARRCEAPLIWQNSASALHSSFSQS